MLMSIFTLFKKAPEFEVWHSHPGQQTKVLITAGVDGDEYAGIEAAKTLIQQFQKNPPLVPVTIIPIVNIAGNQSGVSHNPLDNRLPKTIYPGSPHGTSSSRLRYQLSQYTQGIKLWLDLHGGAHDEEMVHFIWADHTGNAAVDARTTTLLSQLAGPSLYSQHTLSPSIPLAKANASYLIFECGELGQSTKAQVAQHLSWVNACIRYISTNNKYQIINNKWIPTYTSIRYHRGRVTKPFPNDLLWSAPTYHVTGS
jgi:predicted deacylase